VREEFTFGGKYRRRWNAGQCIAGNGNSKKEKGFGERSHSAEATRQLDADNRNYDAESV